MMSRFHLSDFGCLSLQKLCKLVINQAVFNTVLREQVTGGQDKGAHVKDDV